MKRQSHSSPPSRHLRPLGATPLKSLQDKDARGGIRTPDLCLRRAIKPEERGVLAGVSGRVRGLVRVLRSAMRGFTHPVSHPAEGFSFFAHSDRRVCEQAPATRQLNAVELTVLRDLIRAELRNDTTFRFARPEGFDGLAWNQFPKARRA